MKLTQFTYQTEIPASAEALYNWHKSDAAFERLVPPGDPVRLIHKDPGLKKGVRADIEMGYPPFSLRWLAEHTECTPGRSFTDVQVKGPCTYWEHQHEMIPLSNKSSILKDTVTYRVPLGFNINSKLEKLFKYRHYVTRSDLQIATELPLSQSSIGVMGQESDFKKRLCSHLRVLGYKTLDKPPFHTVVIFEDEVDIPDDTDTVIHIAPHPPRQELSCKHYIRLVPANILWPTFGLLRDLISLPIWKQLTSLPDQDVQWISLDDAVYGIYYAISQAHLGGTFSLATPRIIPLSYLYQVVRSAHPFSFSIKSHPLKIKKNCDSPSLFTQGAPLFLESIEQLIETI